MRCEICGHIWTAMHRIKAGAWGGQYDSGNVAYLCPNHHAAIHLLTTWFYTSGKGIKGDEQAERLQEYLCDQPLREFFYEFVKPVIVERMQAEGRWYPYVRTLPDDEREISRRANIQAIKRKERTFRRRHDENGL